MNTRLQQFLELENLTPARLADMLGIQRSGLSHILSGRNKPSYDFLNRILMKFPHINADWLMTGRGKAYRDPHESVIISGTLPPSQNGSFSQGRHADSSQLYNSVHNGQSYGVSPCESSQSGNSSVGASQLASSPYRTAPFGAQQPEDLPIMDNFEDIYPEADKDEVVPENSNIADIENITPDFNTSQPSENGVKAQTKPHDGKKKRIKRVIVFYNDGSFEELFPHIR